MAISISVPSFNIVTLARLLRREAVEQYVHWIRIACVCLSMILYGVLIYYGLTTYLSTETWRLKVKNEMSDLNQEDALAPPSLKAERQDYAPIVEKTVFGELEQKTATPAPTAVPVNRAELTLIGTFVSNASDSFAIIENKKDKTQSEFKVGETIFGAASLKTIKPDQVEVEQNGSIEILRLDELIEQSGPEPPAAAGSEDVSITASELDKALENLPLLLTQARAVPYFQDGKSVGLRLFAIRGGSLYEKLGLTNGDILKSVNGSGLTDFSQAAELFQKLKEERSITLVLERNKQDKEIRYQIK